MTSHDPPKEDHREGESPAQHLRSDRAFLVNDRWYFRTREHIDVGPYRTRERAELAMAQLATMLDGINDMQITRTFIREFMLLK